ncbi:MAG: M1 family aminopeptidase [Bacteroidia bacterium]
MKKLLIVWSLCQAAGTLYSQHECAVSKVNSGSFQPAVSSAHTNLENRYDARFHHLDISMERTNKNISGSVRTIATVLSATLDTFAVELYNTLIIDSIIVNGAQVSPSRVLHAVSIPLSPVLSAGSTIDAMIYYHGTAPTVNGSAIGDGFNNGTSGSWGNQITWSLSEPYSAYEWFPCKQQLQDKLDSVYVFITTDSTNKAGSNGILTNVVTIGNKKRHEWKERNPIDYYLVSATVGQYVEYDLYAHPAGISDSVLVQNYVYNNPATLPYFKSAIDNTPAFIELFSNLYGMYPWANEKYGHCMAPFGGGMEHQTMTSLGSFSFTLIAHELAHQWFGDQVTCRTWHDIFINESFATYSEQLALEYLDPTNAAANMTSVHNNVMSQAGGSVYNPDTTNVNRIFSSRLSYDKGCAIIHSLRFEINDDTLFFNALKNFQQQFKNGTASIDDFKTSVENFTGMNFGQFFAQWIYGEGYPTFNVKWNQVGNTFLLKSTETVSMSSVTPLFITPIEYRLVRSIGDTVIRVNHTQAMENYTFAVGGTVTNIIVDPNNWILNKVVGPTHDITLVGIAGHELAESIRAYPNPAKDKVVIELPAGKEFSVGLYEMTGKQISDHLCVGISTLNMSTVEAGIYFIQIRDKSGVMVKALKLIKE